MYRFIINTALLGAISYSVEGRKLPSYIKPCKIDANLNKCALAHAKDSIPSILKGDKHFKSPPLAPLHLDSIEIHPSDKFSIILKDITLSGLETVEFKDIKLDLTNKIITTNQSFSLLNIKSQYVIDGNILVLTIRGNGPANLTFENMDVDYSFEYTFIKKSDGKEYIDIIKPTTLFRIKKSHFDFGNLFNGNKALGDNVNKFLNDNGPGLTKDLGISVSETISAVVTNILKLYFSVVPYENLFA